MAEGATIITTAVVYLLILLGIGNYARRRTRDSREDYFLASRRFRTVALLFGLLATMLTAFALLGLPGQAYKAGIGVYGYVYGFTTLWAPILIATVGYRVWIAGKRWGTITPAQIMDQRYGTRYIGLGVMALMTFWTVPYLLLGVMGAGITLSSMTGGLITYPVGAGVVTLVVFLYVATGGMRGATWTNIFQGGLFLTLLLVLVAYIGLELGGLRAATQATLETAPGLLSRAGPPPFGTQGWASFAVMIGMAITMYPQMFLRFFTALSPDTFKRTVVLFPLGLMIAGTAVMFGVWGHGQLPGLTGSEVDQIFPLLIDTYLPTPLVALGLVAILAAVMSSLDAQSLTVSTMVSEDVITRWTDMSEAREVLLTRGLLAALLLLVYLIALTRPDTIFGIGTFAFQGYALIFYPFVIGLYWKGATARGVWAALITGFTGLWLFKIGVLPATATMGFLPFIPVLLVQIAVMHLVSRLTDTPDDSRVEEFFHAFDGVW